MSIWPANLSAKGASELMSWFSSTFSGALVDTTVLTLLLERFADKKKRFSRGVLANTVRFLRFFPLEILRFFAPDGITELLVLKKVYGEFTLVLHMVMCFSKSRFICFSPKICFIKTRWSKMHNQMCHANMVISHRAEIPCLDVQEGFMNIVIYCLLTYVYIFPKCFWDTNTVEV